jgi:hypothetical protein
MFLKNSAHRSKKAVPKSANSNEAQRRLAKKGKRPHFDRANSMPCESEEDNDSDLTPDET